MMNAIPVTVQEVLDLFEGELAHVKFGDLEGPVLSLASDEVLAAAAATAVAETALAAARAVLTERQEALLKKTQRALAYLKVYAEGDAALSARLEQIALPKGGRRQLKLEGTDVEESATPPERRRGRPRRTPAPGALLEVAEQAP